MLEHAPCASFAVLSAKPLLWLTRRNLESRVSNCHQLSIRSPQTVIARIDLGFRKIYFVKVS